MLIIKNNNNALKVKVKVFCLRAEALFFQLFLFIETLAGKELTAAVRTLWSLLCVTLFHLFAVFAQLFPHFSSLLGDFSD